MGDADGKRALGAEHLAPSCTTHFSVVDRDGNMAAVTQTLLSNFGSKFVAPQSGIILNNGIMWFDPTPGGANSLAPGKRCLTNYTPVVARMVDGKRLALGASGGRRILPAVTQILSFVMDFGMDLDAAIHQPRIDASEGEIVIGNVRLPQQVREGLRARFDYEETRTQTYPGKFAFPSVVLREGNTNSGATEVFSNRFSVMSISRNISRHDLGRYFNRPTDEFAVAKSLYRSRIPRCSGICRTGRSVTTSASGRIIVRDHADTA